LYVETSLPDGAIFVEVDEDEQSPEPDQMQAASPTTFGEDCLKPSLAPATPGGNHRIIAERRKEKGNTHSADNDNDTLQYLSHLIIIIITFM
jgi:hypothetical protein